MRIRVTIDVPKPLLRKKKLNISLPTQVWVQFKYERLPNFCFCCGVLNHGHKECKTWMAALKVYEKERLLYGNSLRAGFNGGIGVASKQRTPMQLKPSSSPVFPMTPNQKTHLHSPAQDSRTPTRQMMPQQGTTAVTFGHNVTSPYNLHEKEKG